MENDRQLLGILGRVALLLTLAGCGRGDSPSGALQRAPGGVKEPAPSQGGDRAAGRAWKSDARSFREHLAKVRKGWTDEQLREHAGVPDKRIPSQWYYAWHQKRPEGGHKTSLYCGFTLKDGRVADIDFNRIVVRGKYVDR